MYKFIIEHNNLMDFGPQVIGLFLYKDFLKDDIITTKVGCSSLV